MGVLCRQTEGNKWIMSKSQLDGIDRKILTRLQDDCRITMQELAEEVGLTASPCHRRVKTLEDRGVIKRYIAIVDQKAAGLPVSVLSRSNSNGRRRKTSSDLQKPFQAGPRCSNAI